MHRGEPCNRAPPPSGAETESCELIYISVIIWSMKCSYAHFCVALRGSVSRGEGG